MAHVYLWARLWMTTWHFRGGETLRYAADGRTRAEVRDFVVGGRISEVLGLEEAPVVVLDNIRYQ
ncbi:hypothetical protein [Spongiactinospora rosea]|uniref:hypothetical protein n=1 Tax=Spongiactinospora rosea TaxID=2248750 RepID=UPI0011C078E7|nr:hypothetical protein [Spongiactinospora rosea]